MARKLRIAAILTVVVAILSFINPLVARADTFQYTVTDPEFGGPFQFSFTEPTLASSGEVTSGFFSITIPNFFSLTSFSWNSAAGGVCPADHIEPDSFDSFGCAAVGVSIAGSNGGDLEPFNSGSFFAPGIFKSTHTTFQGVMTVTITDLSVPEPSTLMLLGTGVLTLFGITCKTRFSLSCKQ